MLALTLAATLASCPTLPADPLELVPDTATLVAGANVGRIVDTALGRALVHGLEADLEAGEALTILAECGVELERIGEVWLARDAGEGRLVVAQADSLTDGQTLECIATELRARDPDRRQPWTRQTGECPTYELRDGSRAWVQGDVLVWARGSMISAVAGPDHRPTSELVTRIAGLDDRRQAHAWLSAAFDRPPAWAIEARSLVAAIDLEAQGRPGLSASFTMHADDLASTATLRDRMLGLFERIAEQLDGLGIEHRLRERARVGLVDGTLAGTIEFDADELRQIHAKLIGAGLF